MYRIWLEEVLGLRVRGDVLTLEPVIPEEWPGFEIDFHYRSATYQIVVRRKTTGDSITAEEDGRPLEAGQVKLADDGQTHRVAVALPPRMALTEVSHLEPVLTESR